MGLALAPGKGEVASVFFHSCDYKWELEKNVALKGKEKYLESEDDSSPEPRNQVIWRGSQSPGAKRTRKVPH